MHNVAAKLNQAKYILAYGALSLGTWMPAEAVADERSNVREGVVDGTEVAKST